MQFISTIDNSAMINLEQCASIELASHNQILWQVICHMSDGKSYLIAEENQEKANLMYANLQKYLGDYYFDSALLTGSLGFGAGLLALKKKGGLFR